MQLRLFNDAGLKILVNVNGMNYMIKRNRFLVVQCPDNRPVTVKLMIKFKSFVLPPVDEIFNEATVWLNVNSTYTLHLQGGMEHQFSIKYDSFSPDEYIEYNRLYIDDPLIKNNCSFEVSNLKKSCRRAKLWNWYTLYLVIATILLTLQLGEPIVEDGVLYLGLIVLGSGFLIWGLIGQIRIRKKLKKVTNLEFVRNCFNGIVEENKSLW